MLGCHRNVGRAPLETGGRVCIAGNAASFVAFSHGAFNSSESAGTSITGRIAAAGDVTLDGLSVNPAAGDSAPR